MCHLNLSHRSDVDAAEGTNEGWRFKQAKRNSKRSPALAGVSSSVSLSLIRRFDVANVNIVSVFVWSTA